MYIPCARADAGSNSSFGEFSEVCVFSSMNPTESTRLRFMGDRDLPPPPTSPPPALDALPREDALSCDDTVLPLPCRPLSPSPPAPPPPTTPSPLLLP